MQLINRISQILSEVIVENEKRMKIQRHDWKDFYRRRLTSLIDLISNFLATCYMYSNMTDSVLISSLIYMDRAVNSRKKLFLTADSILPMLIGSLTVAMKFHLDCFNISQFPFIMQLSNREMQSLETNFLEVIDYRCFIDQNLFKQYQLFVLHTGEE